MTKFELFEKWLVEKANVLITVGGRSMYVKRDEGEAMPRQDTLDEPEKMVMRYYADSDIFVLFNMFFETPPEEIRAGSGYGQKSTYTKTSCFSWSDVAIDTIIGKIEVTEVKLDSGLVVSNEKDVDKVVRNERNGGLVDYQKKQKQHYKHH